MTRSVQSARYTEPTCSLKKGSPRTQDLTGRGALITGGNSGIGRAVADNLAARGAHVIISGRDAERGGDAVSAIRDLGGTADFIATTLTTESDARALAAKALTLAGGSIDILVNNAGVFPFGPTAAVNEAEFDAVHGLNVKAPFFLVAELAPRMAERQRGSIVNITTMAAHFGAPGMALYGSTKAALAHLTKAWANEFGPSGVRVNAVSPGPTRTEGTAIMGDGLDQLTKTVPLGRAGLPEEIAAAVGFLAGDAGSYVNGAIVPVDGGRIAV